MTEITTLEWCDWIVSEGIGRLFPLPVGDKYPPPARATGKSKAPKHSMAWTGWDTAARLTHDRNDANVGISLNAGYVAIDIDTRKMSTEEWSIADPLLDCLTDPPVNTTDPDGDRKHGHYIYKADNANYINVTGKLVYGLGDFIRPTHRYICTGSGYTKQIPDQVEWLPPQVSRLVQRRRLRMYTPRRSTASEADVMRYIRNERKLPNGARNDGMCRIAGAIVNRGGTYRDLQINNEMLCQPPLADAELARIWESISGRKS